ncbi:MAG: polysaccharide deacetylase family protein [Saprospiraceae bacterium]|nr:polysaccharide deacetylase family protein [Saprospiraceae bacterium]
MSSKIVITIPSVNIPEVAYTFHCLLSVFLGLRYEIVIDDEACDYTITCNFQTLQIANFFFKDDRVQQLYQHDNLPSAVNFSDIELENIQFSQVIFFGNSSWSKQESGFKWGNDIVAASFYMLTRWEETVIENKDEHNRFLAIDSLAYKNNFLHRPIVNEYVEILYHILKSFGLDQIRKVRKYTTLATHDVDRPFLWDSTLGKIRSIGASLLIRRNKEEIKLRAQNIVTGTDPFDTFDLLMDMSESIGEKAHFFFMAGGETEFDNFYQLGEQAVIDLIKRIKERNHCIGIHPSYNTYNNTEMLSSEIDALKMATGMEVTASRQHYLRFDTSSTWNNLEDADVRWDSTMGYPDEAGFRSGVCYTYPLYDIYNRKQLNLLEKPLIVMDATLLRYEKLQIEQALSRVENLQKEVHRYQGEFVFLWHNSSFNSQEWIGFDEVYKSMYRQF